MAVVAAAIARLVASVESLQSWARRNIAFDEKTQATVVSAAGAAVVLGSIGAAVGLAVGTAIGAIIGILFALVSMGLSIPIAVVLGAFCGLLVGAYFGGLAGLVGGGVYLQRAWEQVGVVFEEFQGLIQNGVYGKDNNLVEVRSKQDLTSGFHAGPPGAADVGPHIAQYLEEAVHLYRTLNDNKTGVSHLNSVEQPRDVPSVIPPEVATFENIVGNFERTGDNSGWMFAKREAGHSPVGKRELWLVVRGSTTVEDWFKDAQSLAAPVDVGLDDIGICLGFYQKACSLIEDMEERKALDAIRKVAKTPFERIFLVGHSLGGAVVTQFQAFSVMPSRSTSINITPGTTEIFDKLHSIWAAALGGHDALNRISTDRVCDRWLTFGLEPAPAFKSKNKSSKWEADSYAFHVKDSAVKRILEQTLVLTIYGADPVPRLNIEMSGLSLPPVRLGLFYASPDTVVMPKKYKVNADAFYLMEGPLSDNRISRFLTWSCFSLTGWERVQQLRNVMAAGHNPKAALQLAAGNLGADHVAMFRPDTFAKALRDLPVST